MRNHKLVATTFAAAFALIGGVSAASAQAQDRWDKQPITVIDGYKYNLPESAAKNLDAVRVLIAMSDALGQTRSNRYGIANRPSDRAVIGETTQGMYTHGAATLNGETGLLDLYWDFRDGVRADFVKADKARVITVAAGDKVWDEKTPGVYGGPGKTTLQERLAMIYLMPNAFAQLGRDSVDKIKTSKSGANTLLIMPWPRFNTEVVATLDALSRPIHAEVKLDGKLYSADYEQYVDDRMDMGVQFPHHIVQKVDGKVVADIKVEWHHANPYLLFPVPKEVAAK